MLQNSTTFNDENEEEYLTAYSERKTALTIIKSIFYKSNKFYQIKKSNILLIQNIQNMSIDILKTNGRLKRCISNVSWLMG